MCLHLSDLLYGVFCVFMEFRSDLRLILDWMTARGWFFDLLSPLKILRVNQFPIKWTDLNLYLLKKISGDTPLSNLWKGKNQPGTCISSASLSFFFLYLPKENKSLHFIFMWSALSHSVYGFLKSFQCQKWLEPLKHFKCIKIEY